jgi:hypothetical protein
MSAIRGRSIIKFTRCLRGKNDREGRQEEEQGLSEEGVACLPNLTPDWLRRLVAVRDHPVLTAWSEQLRAVGTAIEHSNIEISSIEAVARISFKVQ